MIRALAAALLLLAACSRSTGGPLEPVEAPGIAVSEDADGNRVATVQAGAVSARVTARWSDTGGQSVMLVYANRGPTAARIDLATPAMTGPAGEVMGGYEVVEVRPKLVVTFMVEALDGRLLNGAVHPLHLTDGPGWFGLVSRCSMSFASQIMSKRI